VLNGVGGCVEYGGVCGGRLSVYFYFYVCVSSRDSEVEKIDVAFWLLLQPVILVMEKPDASFEKGTEFFVGYTYYLTCFRGLSVDN